LQISGTPTFVLAKTAKDKLDGRVAGSERSDPSGGAACFAVFACLR
jgi:hypothetical protein